MGRGRHLGLARYRLPKMDVAEGELPHFTAQGLMSQQALLVNQTLNSLT